MNISTRHFIRKNDYVTREIAGETLIVPVNGHVDDLDSIYTLTELGTVIWRLLDGRANVDQIVEAVCQGYAISPEQARMDTLDFLQTLEENDLIVLMDDSGKHRP
jgi:Coenzyme PQQ synthesis protein D (PqqD)